MTRWVGTSRIQPEIVRYRTISGCYAIRISCWHGRVGDMAYPDRATVENWEWYAWLNPCRWVPDCPRFDQLRQTDTRGVDGG